MRRIGDEHAAAAIARQLEAGVAHRAHRAVEADGRDLIAPGVDGADAVPPGNGHLGLIGFALAALAWLWALGTSLQILRAAKKTAAAPPPVLAATTWQKTGQVISRRFEFADFAGAMKFVNGVAALAEAAGHHPDMDIRWNKVTLTLTTHDAGGLTDKDYSLALACDELYARSGGTA